MDLKDGKTKELAMILKNLPISKKKTLIVLPPAQKDVAIAAKNMKGIETMPSNTLNVVDLLKADVVLISKEAIDMITQTYKRA